MMNFKQKELAEQLFNKVKNKFPEIELITIARSPDDSSHILIHVVPPEDEDKKIAMRSYASKKSHEILLKFGYWLSIISNKKEPEEIVTK